jgi:hypothetical protein
MGSVVISGATSGAVTLAVPDEAGTRTLTLPATTGTILTNDISQAGDTSAGNAAAVGYTSAEGLILTGQGTTSDVTIKNDADATVLSIPTGTTNVGIGTTSPATKLEIYNAGFTAAQITSNSSSETQLRFATNTAARISNQANTALIFDTNATERMRIDSSGKVNIGTTTPENGNTHVSVRQSGIGSNGFWSHATSTSDGGSKYVATTAITTASSGHYFFEAGYNWPTSFARAFAVRGDGVIFALNTTVQALSDERLKENIVNATDGLDIITALRPVRFDWKKETGIEKTNQLGFIAQEVEQVFPDAVDTYSNNDNSEDPYKSVGAGALIPVLVKAIQEQQETITALETRLAALEAN